LEKGRGALVKIEEAKANHLGVGLSDPLGKSTLGLSQQKDTGHAEEMDTDELDERITLWGRGRIETWQRQFRSHA